jgi:hypothetical protein
MDRLDRMLALVRSHIPDVRLVVKHDVAWLRRVAPLIEVVTPGFMTQYTTVVGSAVMLPRPIDRLPRDILASILAHELVHQLDQQRWGPAFYASYALALPAGRTARAAWERRAYAVDLMLAHHDGGEAALAACERRLVGIFAGRGYAWMWAGEAAAREFLRPTVTAVADGALQTTAPYREILDAWR